MLALHRCASWLWNAIILLLSWVHRRRERRRLRRLWQAVKPVIRSLRESRARQRQPATALGGWSEPFFQRQMLSRVGMDSTSSVYGEEDQCFELRLAISDDTDAGAYHAYIDWGDSDGHGGDGSGVSDWGIDGGDGPQRAEQTA